MSVHNNYVNYLTTNYLSQDVICKITSYLKVGDLYQWIFVSNEFNFYGSKELTNRAHYFGYQAPESASCDSPGPVQYLRKLFQQVKKACRANLFLKISAIIQEKYIILKTPCNPVPASMGTIDYEETLLNLETIPIEDWLEIMHKIIQSYYFLTKAISSRISLFSKKSEIEVSKAIKSFNVNIFLNAAKFGHQKIVEFMLNHRFDINAKDYLVNQTALISASFGDCPIECFKFLLSKGADVNLSRYDGTTALHFAARFTTEAHVRCLIEHGAHVDAPSKTGLTPLMAVRSIEIASLLLEKGANINACSQPGYSVLMWYNERDTSLIISSFLIEKGANLNHTDDVGDTRLHQAAKEGKENLVALLLVNGADTQIRNKQELTAFDLAQKQGHQAIVNMISSPHLFLRAP